MIDRELTMETVGIECQDLRFKASWERRKTALQRVADRVAAYESLIAAVFALPDANFAGDGEAGADRVAEALETWRQS